LVERIVEQSIPGFASTFGSCWCEARSNALGLLICHNERAPLAHAIASRIINKRKQEACCRRRLPSSARSSETHQHNLQS
jgi:hypothetical protein